MGLLSRGPNGNSHPSTQIDADISQSAGDAPGTRYRIAPDPENGGMATAARVWGKLHTPEMSRLRGNVSDPLAFELQYDGEYLELYMQTSAERAESLETRLNGAYPESRIDAIGEVAADEDSPGFPEIEAGDIVAGATVETDTHSHYPLNGWGDLEHDPYSDIIEEMTTGESRVVIQVIARDEPHSWTRGTDGGLLGSGTQSISEKVETLRAGESVGWRDPDTREPTEDEKTKANIIEEEKGKRGFNTSIRILVIGADETEVQHRCSKLEDSLEGAYEDRRTEQQLVASPVSSQRLSTFIDRCLDRTWEDHDTILTAAELSALAHAPVDDEISNAAMRWCRGDLGVAIPPSHARVDFEALGCSTDASRLVKQAAVLDETGRGDPYVIGWGAKEGTEAGIFEDYTDKHIQITGRTGTGKTTLVSNLSSQIMNRGYGALIIVLGKEDDDEDIIARWPGDRPREDFVFLDTGGEFKKKVRFNLLDVPAELEPDTNAHTSYVENLCDDFCAAFAQAGGDDSLYPLMKGVTRTLVRGMARSNRTCTPLDLAEAAARHENMTEFLEWMETEGIHFIDDSARRFAEEKDEGDFEPIARRMDEIRQNPNVREWLAARQPTVRPQTLVNEGKVTVLRIDEGMADSEQAFAINPIVRRFGFSKKMASKFGTNDDPYYFIWDEADKAVTKHSSVAKMLSEYRGYGARFCLMYQAPSFQLPSYLKRATETQIGTTISFASKSRDASFVAKQHSKEIDSGSLTSIPEYTYYLNTGSKGRDETPSVRVDAFDPPDDAHEEVGNQGGMTDEEIQELKRESVERYGAIPPSTAEMKAQTHFSSGTIDGEGVPEELDMSTEYCRNQALAAVFDQSIRDDGTPGFVAVEDDLDRLQHYLPGGEALTDADKAYRSVIQKIPDGYIGKRKNDAGEREVKALDTSFMNIGETENDGGAGHGELLADAYTPLTQLGFRSTVPDQTGEAMPDGLASVEDALDLAGVADPDQIAQRVGEYRREHPLLNRLAGAKDAYIEAEKSTGDSQPSQTVLNLAQAHNAGHRCLFTARPDVAERVYNTVGRSPMGCRSGHSVEGERRFYTGTGEALTIDGEKMTRPGASDNVWVHDKQSGQYILRDHEGTVHARFDTVTEIFSNADAYPDEGERNIKRPVIPEYEIDDDLDEVEWDIIVVPEAPRDDDGQKELLSPADLTLYHDDEPNVPLPDLLAPDDDPPTDSDQEETEAATDTSSSDSDIKEGVREML